MEYTVKERIRLFIRHLGISERQFCLSIGASPAFVANIVKSIQPDKINSITKQYPELNAGWLLTGDGDMLKNNINQIANGDGNTQVAGNGNTVSHGDISSSLSKALDELAAQRRLTEKAQEQIDRLIGLLERK